MTDTDEIHLYADDIIWALIDSLELEEIEDEEQVGEFPGAELAAHIPYIAVEVVEGGADFFESRPIVNIDVFASSRKVAKSVSAAIQLALLRYPISVTVGDSIVTIDRVVCTRSPVKIPWEDEAIRRQSATYELEIRR